MAAQGVVTSYLSDKAAPMMADSALEGDDAQAPPYRTKGNAPHRLSADAPPHRLSADAPPHRLSADAPPHRLSADAPTISDSALEGDDAQAPPHRLSADAPPHRLSADAPTISDSVLEGDDAQGEATADEESAWFNVRSPLNLEAKNEATADEESAWFNVRSPLNLEAKEAGAFQVTSVGVDAAQPWWNVRSSLTLEAQEAKQVGDGATPQLEALTGTDQLHLLVGGSLLLAAGVAINFVRRARQRKATERALEDETYFLMA